MPAPRKPYVLPEGVDPNADTGGPRKRTHEEKAANLTYLRRNFVGIKPRDRCTTPALLPKWVKDAIAMHDLLGMSWRQVCAAKSNSKKKFNPKQLQAYLGSAGAKQFRKAIADQVDDPVGVTKKWAEFSAPWLLFKSFQHLEICAQAGDLAEYGRTLRNLQAVAKLEAQDNKNQMPQQVIINLPAGASIPMLQGIPMGESSAEKVLPAEIVGE